MKPGLLTPSPLMFLAALEKATRTWELIPAIVSLMLSCPFIIAMPPLLLLLLPCWSLPPPSLPSLLLG